MTNTAHHQGKNWFVRISDSPAHKHCFCDVFRCRVNLLARLEIGRRLG